MNIQHISLSSINTNTSSILPLTQIIDRTTLILNLSGVTERLLPTFLSIDWGDGGSDFYENDILQNINLVENRYSSILINTCSHEYLPLSDTTSANLTATVNLKYINGDLTTFVLPISSTNYDFQNGLEDLTLLNTKSDIKGQKTHIFLTKKDGYLVEMKTPIK